MDKEWGLDWFASLYKLGDHLSMKAILIFLIFLPSIALTKTIFEPSLALGTGSFKGKISGSAAAADGTPVEATYSSLSAGFRYGITRRYIHVTGILEGYFISSSAKLGTAAEKSENLFKTNVGIGIGYEWNIPLRTYLIIGSPYSGVELSYYVSEHVLVGIKYSKMEFGFEDTDLSVSSYGVAVTFPFEFEYPDHWWRKTNWE